MVDENTPLIAGENRNGLLVTENQSGYEAVQSSALPPQPALLERISSGATLPATRPASDQNVESQDAPSNAMFANHFVNVTPTQFWWIFGGVQIGYLIGFFDSTFMASSHPVITSDFHASNSASWLSTAFLLTSTALLPLFGRISDVVGRRPVYLFSISVFFITTAWCALAQSMGSFIIARAFCGLGAGGVFSMGMIICSDIVRLEYRGVYQSGINMTLGLGGALGYAGGGALCDRLGWRGAFAIQLPFIFAYLLIALWTTPRDLGRVNPKDEFPTISQLLKRIDLTGSFLLTVGVTALLIGINLGGNVLSWSHPLVISSLGLAAVVAIILPFYESRVERPVMPIRLLTQAPHSYIIFSNFFGALAVNSVMFNIPLFFQAVKLESATNSGLHLLPVSVGATFSSVLTGILITLFGKLKSFAVIGAVLIFLGGLSTATLTLVDLPYVVTMTFLSLACAGQGFAFPTHTVAILAVNKQEDQAACVTTMGLGRNLGFVLGVAVSSLVLQNLLRIRLDQVVTGPDKQSIIDVARKSVESIVTLDPVHREQVVQAYTFSLRLTFLSAAIWGSIMLLLTVMVKLPVLKRGEKKMSHEDEEED